MTIASEFYYGSRKISREEVIAFKREDFSTALFSNFERRRK
jgi:hypothetical protein